MKSAKLLFGIATIILLAGCASSGDKPLTAKGLFDRHVEVAYGGKGMGIHPSVTQQATFFMDDFGIEAPIEVKVMDGGNMVFGGEIMGMATSQGCNPSGCWNQQPGQGVADLEGEMLDNFRIQADIRGWENIDKYYESLEIVTPENPADATEYTVKAVSKYGRENLYYFSKETGLLTGMTITSDSPMGVTTQNTSLKEYKDFGGILWATVNETSTAMGAFRIVTENVSYEPLSAKDFMRPE